MAKRLRKAVNRCIEEALIFVEARQEISASNTRDAFDLLEVELQ